MRARKKIPKSAKRSSTKYAERAEVVKAMNIRLPKDMWYFLKQMSLDEEMSINAIVTNLIGKFKDRREGF